MPVGLVPHVPYDAVVRGVEHVVQGHRYLHHSETGSEVSRIDRELVHNHLSEFVAQLGQLLHAELAQVGGHVDAFEQ